MLVFAVFCSFSETRKLQRIAREHIKRVLDEQEMLNIELESKKKRLDSWSKELKSREALTERERQKLEEEKKKASLFHPFCFCHLCVVCLFCANILCQ